MNHKHEAFGVSLHSRYGVFAELNRDTKVAVSDSDDSTEQEILIHEEDVVLDKRRSASGVANQPCLVSKVSKSETSFWLVTVRDVNLGKEMEDLKEVRYLAGVLPAEKRNELLRLPRLLIIIRRILES